MSSKLWEVQSGAGYIILDAETGEGAYKISGGSNGGGGGLSLMILAKTCLVSQVHYYL